jgi:hypothetical protein
MSFNLNLIYILSPNLYFIPNPKFDPYHSFINKLSKIQKDHQSNHPHHFPRTFLISIVQYQSQDYIYHQ